MADSRGRPGSAADGSSVFAERGADAPDRTIFSAFAWHPRVDDRRIVSGIIYVIKHGLMWRDAPKGYGPHKTTNNRFIRWSRLGVFNRIFSELVGKAGEPDQVMIDATHLKAHRTAASLLKGGLFPDVSGAPRAG